MRQRHQPFVGSPASGDDPLGGAPGDPSLGVGGHDPAAALPAVALGKGAEFGDHHGPPTLLGRQQLAVPGQSGNQPVALGDYLLALEGCEAPQPHCQHGLGLHFAEPQALS